MTPYQLRDGNYIHNLDTDDLIKRANVMWAKLEKPGRVHMVQYTRVKFMTEYEYTCAEPPPVTCTAITIWRPTIELPISELGYFREGSKQKAIPGVNLLTSNVRIVLTLPVAA